MSGKPRRQPGDNSFHWTLQRNLPFTYHSVLRISRAGSPALYCTEYSVHQPVPAWPTVTICSTRLLAVVEGGVLTRQERSDGPWSRSLHSRECSSQASALTSLIHSFVSSFLFPLLASIAPVVWRISSLLSMMVQMFCITLGCPLLLSCNSPEVALWCLSLYL